MAERDNKLEEPDFETLAEESRSRSPLVAASILLTVVVAAVTAILLLKSCGEEGRMAVPEGPAVAVSPSVPPPPAPDLPGPPAGKPAAADVQGAVGGGQKSVAKAPEPFAAQAGPPSLPGLDESNELAEKLLRDCLAGPVPPLPAAGGSLIRLFVVVVDNVAEGASPRPHLGFLGFDGDFAVVERQGRQYIDPDGYRRYDKIARIFAGLDAEACAAAYESVAPLVDQSYRDLGYPERSFDETLHRAIARVVEIAIPQGDILLIEGEGAYHFEDPALEALGGMEKQVLRMGPGNGRTVQESLRRLRTALGRGARR